MLDQQTKDAIQTAYREWLANKGFKARRGQRQMIADVANTLGNIEVDGNQLRVGGGHVCAIEAGTGTGKTVAYTLAALPIARAQNKKLVVATATIMLQNQLAQKDLPDFKQNSKLKFSYALAKGRSRYLCLSKLAQTMSDHQSLEGQALFADEEALRLTESTLDLYDELFEALDTEAWNGDLDAWSQGTSQKIPPQDWQRVTTDHAQCSNRRCEYFDDCPYFKARNKIDQAEVIVANHDLVLADLMLGGGVLLPKPEDTFYIFDEGHHLPDKAIKHFHASVRINSLKQWLEQLPGACAQIAGHLSHDDGRNEQLEELPGLTEGATNNLEFVATLLEGIEGFEPDRNRDSARLRFPRGEIPEPLHVLAGNLQTSFARIHAILANLSDDLQDAAEEGGVERQLIAETLQPRLAVLVNRIEQACALWQAYRIGAEDGKPPHARWITRFDDGRNSDYELSHSPIDAAQLLDELLWKECHGAVVTSATLSSLGNFARFAARSGVPSDTYYGIMPSPFDYANVATLKIPQMAVEPTGGAEFVGDVVAKLNPILQDAQAALVLFSSRQQLQDVLQGIDSAARGNILLQDDYSKQALVTAHQKRIDSNQASCIFGLASMAEGIDLPGDYLTHVVIVRLPFAVPDDPVEATLTEWISDGGGNPFWEISVPDAALKLKQACGRLLRSEQDSGTVTILDKRLLTKRYGKALIDSLPAYRREFNC